MTVKWLPSYAPVDEEFGNVSLLLHGDGTNGSTTIVDSSSSPKAVTAVGDAQISTAQSKFGGSSIAFDGTGDTLNISSNASFGFGTGDFTVEFWLYYQGGNGYVFFWIQALGPPSTPYLGYGLNAGSKNPWLWNNVNVLTTTTAVTNNIWQHHAVVRSNGVLSIYLDGIALGSTTFTENLDLQKPLTIASNGASAQFTNGFIDDFRITKGIARYTSNFTPPTAPFPDLSPTTRLTA